MCSVCRGLGSEAAGGRCGRVDWAKLSDQSLERPAEIGAEAAPRARPELGHQIGAGSLFCWPENMRKI